MHARRFASFLLGLWLGGGLLMMWIEARNSRTVDRLLSSPPSAVARIWIKSLGAAGPTVVRYEVAEERRELLEGWQGVEIVLGFGLFLFLLFGSHESNLLPLGGALLMLAVTLGERLWLTPEIHSLTRSFDFLPGVLHEQKRLGALYTGFYALEALKYAVGLVLVGRMVLARQHGRSRNLRKQFDVVDKADHGHING